MNKPTLVAISSLALAACGERSPQVISVQGADAELRERMTVTGTATLEVSPDLVDLTMTVSADGARPGLAAADVQRKQQELVAALGTLGIEGTDLKLSQLALRPIYAQSSEAYQLKVATYRAEITVTATTKRFDQIGAVMESGANHGATEMSTQFRRSDLPELKKRVRDLALAAAKAKAEQSAKALGIPLGRVVSVEETPQMSAWGRSLYPNYLGNNPGNSAGSAPVGGAGLGGTLQPLTLDITISFHLPKEA